MFAPGSDQADGLKRWFQPPQAARLDLVSVGADATLSFSAERISQSLDALGLGVQWEDPESLLTANDTLAPESTGHDIQVVVGRLVSPSDYPSAQSLGRLFVAPADPAMLQRLYGAIKSSLESSPEEPISIMWSGSTVSFDMQKRCTENLSRTADQFLGFELRFLNSAVATSARQARALMEPVVAPISQHVFERRETAPVFHN
ncbi:MAG: hypothetical protein AB8C46_02215 [Burkholderiaceae bacterium]